MADYYPLLSKAAAALPNSTPETRAAIYGRARSALIRQLQSAGDIAPQDIDREAQALDDAVRRIEEEYALHGPVVAAAERSVPRSPGRSLPANRPREGTATRPALVAAPAARATERPEVTAGRLWRNAEAPPENAESPKARSSRARRLIVAGTVAVLIVVIGATAYKIRETPEQLRLEQGTARRAAEPVADLAGGKITGRADPAKEQPSTPVPTVKVATIPIRPPGATSELAKTVAPAPTLPVKTPARPAPAPDATTPVKPDTTPAAPAAASTAATVPVAYRSALLVQTGADPQSIKTYIGSVTWRTENVSGDQSQQLATAIQADVDVPEAKLKVVVTIKKNTDAAFQASHTIVVGFTFGAGSPLTKVKEMDLPQLRNEDSPTGDTLAGVGVVPIMEDFFLVGLATGEDAVHRNLDLMKSKGWFDFPIQLNDGKVAKLTLEKGVQGQQAVNDALAAWK